LVPRSRRECGGSSSRKRHRGEGASNRGRFLLKNWSRVTVPDTLLRESVGEEAGYKLALLLLLLFGTVFGMILGLSLIFYPSI